MVVLAGCGESDDASEPSASTDPAELVLTVSDLPDGYQIGDDSGCGLLGVEGASTRQRDLALKYQPNSCSTVFERLYVGADSGTGPRLVVSSAVVFPSSESAEQAMTIVDELIEYAVGEEQGSLLESAGSESPVGADTRVFSTNDATVAGKPRQPGAAVAWRSGTVVATLYVGGPRGPAAESAALALAEQQQQRIEAPVAVEPEQQDDRDVALDDPSLGIDVYWLGRSFDPSGDLPELTLYKGYGPIEPGGGPGYRAEVEYDIVEYGSGVDLGIWERAAWERFIGTELGRLVWASPCAEKTRVDLADGRAEVYAGFGRRGPTDPCPEGPFDRFLAHAYLGNVVVSVNIPNCLSCAPEPSGNANPYNSREGMLAVVRALGFRQPSR